MELLVIEDDPVIGKLLRKGLIEAGHGCVWAKEGERGLELAAGQQFDAIILDMMLPGFRALIFCSNSQWRQPHAGDRAHGTGLGRRSALTA